MFKWKREVSARLDFISNDILRLDYRVSKLLHILEEKVGTSPVDVEQIQEDFKRARKG